jgi:sigma-E factor negative regulatory protein RseC
MSEICKVCAINGNQITLQQDGLGKDACFGCIETECKNKKRFITLEIPGNLLLKKGESVKIKANPMMSLVQAAAALGLPLLGFMAGFFLTAFLFPQSREPTRAAAGVLLMFSAAFGYYQFRRRHPLKNPFKIIGCHNSQNKLYCK